MQSNLPQAMIVQGDYLFMPTISGLRMINIKDPYNPFLGKSFRSKFLNDFTVVGQYALLCGSYRVQCERRLTASWTQGLEIVPISAPQSSYYFPLMGILSMHPSGSYVYVAADSIGLEVLDASDLVDGLVPVGMYLMPYIMDACVSGSYAYTTQDPGYGSELQIIDISNPIFPSLVGKLEFNQQGEDRADYVTVSGNYAYLVGNVAVPHPPVAAAPILSIVDVSNPQNPVLVGSVQRNSSWGGAVHPQVLGNYVFLKDLYANPVQTGHQLGIYDVTNKSAPRRIAGYSPAIEFISFTVSGTCAYISDGISKLEVVDISDPSQPVLVTTYDIS